MKDIFEEFEFKPLTEGLGFHKNSKNQMHGAQSDSVLENKMPEIINTPLPRQKAREVEKSERPSSQSSTVDAILHEIQKNDKLNFIEQPAPTKAMSRPSTNDFSAVVLDSMLVLASYLACLIILLVVTKVDLVANLMRPDPRGMVYLSLLALLASVTWIYLVTNRLFLGHTPGEWIFDQRLGTEKNFKSPEYGLKVALRSLLVVVTGFFAFPILSWILNSDVLGRIVNLELQQKAD